MMGFHKLLDLLKLLAPTSLLLVVGCAAGNKPPASPPKQLLVSPQSSATSAGGSTFFATAAEESFSTYQLYSDGDLWPSCWADDGNLYAVNGDGTAFTHATSRYDMAVSLIRGMPPALTGRTIATDVGSNWSGRNYNRKPTGMLCIRGAIYLAFQNLSLNFMDVPAASIAKSTDHGKTWTWDKTVPMFGTPAQPDGPLAYQFTTIFFLDYGKNSRSAIDSYVYAYGLDKNWRSQQAMYLARVPAKSVQTRSAWEFYEGADSADNPLWSRDITRKAAVLTDERLLYTAMLAANAKTCEDSHKVIGQGGVVYDAPLKRYIFASWSCATHEFYEAPNPWGPWRHFLSTDFGPLKTAKNYGQYGTSIPSKFISADGRTMYLQSNVWGHSYAFALRKLFLQPYVSASPANGSSDANLALAQGTRAISKSIHYGLLCGADCSDQLASGMPHGSEDDFDKEAKTTDWWGYTWPQPYSFNQVVYITGDIATTGGWYANKLRVQVRQHFQWRDVTGVTSTPPYPHSEKAGSHVTYRFNLPDDTWDDGIRIIGVPGGTSHFTSISQLAIYDKKR
jgi:Domain of unknown function (DUF4185)